MIVETKEGNILMEKHIAVIMNDKGEVEPKIAKIIEEKFGKEILSDIGEHIIGAVVPLMLQSGTIIYAMSCYCSVNGWGENHSEIIKKCLNKIPIKEKEYLAMFEFEQDVKGLNQASVYEGMEGAKNKIKIYLEV